MRYKLCFELENKIIPVDYRRSIISFIKFALNEYNEEIFLKLYNNKDNIIKPYAFAIFFKAAKFSKEEIIIEDKKMEMNITIEDYNIAINLYNAFNHQRNNKFSLNKNSMILKNIMLVQEKEIVSETIKIKFLSPLVVRDRNIQTQKDYYYTYKDERFLEILKINIREQLKISNLSIDLVDEFNIIPIIPKKTVVKFYEKQIACSIGIYEIHGDIRLLNYLYKAGVGSKHSAGFGMFQVL